MVEWLLLRAGWRLLSKPQACEATGLLRSRRLMHPTIWRPCQRVESCAGDGDIAGEALTEALAGRLASREHLFSGADLVDRKGRPYRPSRLRKRRENPAWSQNPCTSGNSSHENRENSEAPAVKWQAGGGRRKPHAPRVRCRGVGAGGSSDERFE